MAHTLLLTERKKLSDHTFELRFSKPDDFSFTPGQFIRFHHAPVERDYSIVSIPKDDSLAICVRDTRNNGFSSRLAEAVPGSEYQICGPYGYFTFQPSERPPVFVATGVGIAPFVSMIRSGIEEVVLLHGVQTSAECYYRDALSHQVSVYMPCLSRFPESRHDFPCFNGRVTDYLKHHLTKQAYDFYLCGRREMIRDVTFLADDFFSGSRVYSEAFF